MPRTTMILTLVVALCWAGTVQADDSDRAAAHERLINRAVEKVLPAYVFVGAGGSGVLVSPDGYILTNDHVAGSAWVWRVRTMDGVQRYADLVGTDAYGDIALLKLREVEKDMPYLPFGDAEALAIGQAVIAIGNPFGMGNVDEKPTVTLGIVSTLHRFQGNYTDAIMTDAPLNPGNSGGPLITLDGKLVGINGQIATRFGVRANSGIGYAIPSHQIRHFLQDLMAAGGGYVHHGTIPGLRMPSPEANIRPPRVLAVQSGTVADEAGFEKGDEVIEVEGRSVTTVTRFLGILGTYPAGSELAVKVRREGEVIDLSVTLAAQGLPGQPTLRATLSGEAYASGRNAAPLHVVEIAEDTPAARAGVQVGDRIVSIAGMDLAQALQMMPQADLLDRLVKGRSSIGGVLLEMTVLRAGRKKQLHLDLEKDSPTFGAKLGHIEGSAGAQGESIQEKELTVLDLVPGCGMWKAGLKAGDVLHSLADRELTDHESLQKTLATLRPGQVVEVGYRREGRDHHAEIRIDLQRAMP